MPGGGGLRSLGILELFVENYLFDLMGKFAYFFGVGGYFETR